MNSNRDGIFMSEKGKKEFKSLLPSLSQLTNVIQPDKKTRKNQNENYGENVAVFVKMVN